MENFDRRKIEKIAKKHDLRLVVLFGSRATGKAREGSDTDIAVLGNKKISFGEIIDLNNELAEALQVRELDVKSLHGVDPLFCYQVMKNGKLLFGKSRDFHSFEAYAFRNFIDSRDLLKLKEVLVKKRLQSIGA